MRRSPAVLGPEPTGSCGCDDCCLPDDDFLGVPLLVRLMWWTVGLAGAVLVLWLGSGSLSPAAAAAAPASVPRNVRTASSSIAATPQTLASRAPSFGFDDLKKKAKSAAKAVGRTAKKVGQAVGVVGDDPKPAPKPEPAPPPPAPPPLPAANAQPAPATWTGGRGGNNGTMAAPEATATGPPAAGPPTATKKKPSLLDRAKSVAKTAAKKVGAGIQKLATPAPPPSEPGNVGASSRCSSLINAGPIHAGKACTSTTTDSNGQVHTDRCIGNRGCDTSVTSDGGAQRAQCNYDGRAECTSAIRGPPARAAAPTPAQPPADVCTSAGTRSARCDLDRSTVTGAGTATATGESTITTREGDTVTGTSGTRSVGLRDNAGNGGGTRWTGPGSSRTREGDELSTTGANSTAQQRFRDQNGNGGSAHWTGTGDSRSREGDTLDATAPNAPTRPAAATVPTPAPSRTTTPTGTTTTTTTTTPAAPTPSPASRPAARPAPLAPAGATHVYRDSAGNGGSATWTGEGTSRTREGAQVTTRGPAEGSHTYPDGRGSGGDVTASVAGTGHLSATTAAGAQQGCNPHGASCTITQTYPGPAGGESQGCQAHGTGSCNGVTAAGERQTCTSRHADRADTTCRTSQLAATTNPANSATPSHPAGATCMADDGACAGSNRAADSITCDGQTCRTAILYRDRDTGSPALSCGSTTPGACRAQGSRPFEWYEPTSDVVAAVDHGWERQRAYVYEPAHPGPSLGQQDRAVLTILDTQRGVRDGNDAGAALAPHIAAVNAAPTDRPLTDAEWAALKPHIHAIDAALPALAHRDELATTLAGVRSAYWRNPPRIGMDLATVGGDRAVVAELGATSGDGHVSPEMIEHARSELERHLQARADAAAAANAFGPRGTALNDRVRAYDTEVARINNNGGATAAQLKALHAERAAIDAQSAQLEVDMAPAQARYNEANRQLRQADIAFARASGDTAYADQLAASDGALTTALGRLATMPKPTDERSGRLAGALRTAARVDENSYDAAVWGPRTEPNLLRPTTLIDFAPLPSTGAPHTRLGMQSAANIPRFENYDGVLGRRAFRVRGAGEGPEKGMTADERANLAAYESPTDVERRRMDTVDELITLKTGIEPGHGTDSDMDRKAAFIGWLSHNRKHPAGWDELTQHLTPQERAKIDKMFSDHKPNYLEAARNRVGDGLGWLNDKLVRGVNWTLGAPIWVEDRAVDWVGKRAGVDHLSRQGWFQWTPTLVAPLGRKITRSAGNVVAHVPQGLVTLGHHAVVETYRHPLELVPGIGQVPGVPGGGLLSTHQESGESWSHGYAREHRLFGMVTDGAVETYHRFQPCLRHLDCQKLGHDYGTDPVGTFLTDISIPALAAGGAGWVLKGGAAAAETMAAGARTAAVDAELASAVSASDGAAAANLARASRLARVASGLERTAGALRTAYEPLNSYVTRPLMRVWTAPLKPWELALRPVASRVAPVVGRVFGPAVDSVRTQVRGATTRMAEARELDAAYRRLGVDPNASLADVRAGYRSTLRRANNSVEGELQTVKPHLFERIQSSYDVIMRARGEATGPAGRVGAPLALPAAPTEQVRAEPAWSAAGRSAAAAMPATPAATATPPAAATAATPRSATPAELASRMDAAMRGPDGRPRASMPLTELVGRLPSPEPTGAALRAAVAAYPELLGVVQNGESYFVRTGSAGTPRTAASATARAATSEIRSTTSPADGRTGTPNGDGTPANPLDSPTTLPDAPRLGASGAGPAGPGPNGGGAAAARSGAEPTLPDHAAELRSPNGGPGKNVDDAGLWSGIPPPATWSAEQVTAWLEPHRAAVDGARAREQWPPQLAAETTALKARRAEGASLEELMPECFALVCEATRRVTGNVQHDVQLGAGIVLQRGGTVAVIKPGEGKSTYIAPMPLILHALDGRGVHYATTTTTLARGAAAFFGPIAEQLGLTVRVNEPNLSPAGKRAAYEADITVSAASELVFDSLRDAQASHPEMRVQGERGSYALIDEVDSIMIDSAPTPHILAGRKLGRVTRDAELTVWATDIAAQLRPTEHFTTDALARTVRLTDAGSIEVAMLAGRHATDAAVLADLHQALVAEWLLEPNVHYVVDGSHVKIIDKNSQYALHGHRWANGLHEAVEAKHGTTPRPRQRTIASTDTKTYFDRYDTTAGATGTADPDAFARLYGWGVEEIPTNRPMIRIDHPDVVHDTIAQKQAAAVADAIQRSAAGQPVLIGAGSIKSSEAIGELLRQAGAAPQVLNALPERMAVEREVTGRAGESGAITVATMAGRGVDILLGGNPRLYAEQELLSRGIEPGSIEWQQAWDVTLARFRAARAADRAAAIQAGGLHTIPTEMYESARVVEQLRSRAARQGEPGSSQAHYSLEDELLVQFAEPARYAEVREQYAGAEQGFSSETVSELFENAHRAAGRHNLAALERTLGLGSQAQRSRERALALAWAELARPAGAPAAPTAPTATTVTDATAAEVGRRAFWANRLAELLRERLTADDRLALLATTTQPATGYARQVITRVAADPVLRQALAATARVAAPVTTPSAVDSTLRDALAELLRGVEAVTLAELAQRIASRLGEPLAEQRLPSLVPRLAELVNDVGWRFPGSFGWAAVLDGAGSGRLLPIAVQGADPVPATPSGQRATGFGWLWQLPGLRALAERSRTAPAPRGAGARQARTRVTTRGGTAARVRRVHTGAGRDRLRSSGLSPPLRRITTPAHRREKRVTETLGGFALLFGGEPGTGIAARVAAELAATEGAVKRVIEGADFRRLVGRTARPMPAGAKGLLVLRGFIDALRASGGPDDVVVLTHGGWMYVDAQVDLARRQNRPSQAAWDRVFRHELGHVEFAGNPDYVATMFPLPELSELADLPVFAPARVRRVAAERRDRAALLAAALPGFPPPFQGAGASPFPVLAMRMMLAAIAEHRRASGSVAPTRPGGQPAGGLRQPARQVARWRQEPAGRVRGHVEPVDFAVAHADLLVLALIATGAMDVPTIHDRLRRRDLPMTVADTVARLQAGGFVAATGTGLRLTSAGQAGIRAEYQRFQAARDLVLGAGEPLLAAPGLDVAGLPQPYRTLLGLVTTDAGMVDAQLADVLAQLRERGLISPDAGAGTLAPDGRVTLADLRFEFGVMATRVQRLSRQALRVLEARRAQGDHGVATTGLLATVATGGTLLGVLAGALPVAGLVAGATVIMAGLAVSRFAPERRARAPPDARQHGIGRRLRQVAAAAGVGAILSLTTLPGWARPATATEAYPAPPAAVVTEQPSPATYVVRPGDWLTTIALARGTSAQTIFEANRGLIADIDLVYPGQVLVIPPLPAGTLLVRPTTTPAQALGQRLTGQLGREPAAGEVAAEIDRVTALNGGTLNWWPGYHVVVAANPPPSTPTSPNPPAPSAPPASVTPTAPSSPPTPAAPPSPVTPNPGTPNPPAPNPVTPGPALWPWAAAATLITGTLAKIAIGRRRAVRAAAHQAAQDQWLAVQPATQPAGRVAPLQLWRALAATQHTAFGLTNRGFTPDQVATGLAGYLDGHAPAWLGELTRRMAWLALTPRGWRTRLDDLVTAGLLVSTDGTYRLEPTLAAMLDRTPAPFLRAVLANPAALVPELAVLAGPRVRITDPAAATHAAAALRATVRGAVFDHGQTERGWATRALLAQRAAAVRAARNSVRRALGHTKRAQRAMAAALTVEQRGWVRWLYELAPTADRPAAAVEIATRLRVPADWVQRIAQTGVQPRAPPGVTAGMELTPAVQHVAALLAADATLAALITAVEGAEAAAEQAERALTTVATAAIDAAAAAGVSRKRAERVLDRANEGVRMSLQGALVGAYDGSGAAAILLAATATVQIATAYGAGTAAVVGLIATAGTISAIGLAFYSIFGNRLGLKTIVVSPLIAAAAFVGMGIAPTFAALAVLYGLLGIYDSTAGIARDRVRWHPLPPTQAARRNGHTQAAFNAALLVIAPLFLAATALLGVRGAFVAAGVCYAGLATATGWALAGGQRPADIPPAAYGVSGKVRAVSQTVTETVRAVRRTARRAFASPTSFARALASPSVLALATGVPYGVLAGLVGVLVAGHLAGLGATAVGVAVVLVNAAFRGSSIMATRLWVPLSNWLGRGSPPRLILATTATQLLVVIPAVLLVAAPGVVPPILSLTLLLITADVASNINFVPLFEYAPGGAATTRLIAGRVFGLARLGIPIGAALAAALTLAVDRPSAALPGLLRATELKLVVAYLAMAAVTVPLAYLVARLKHGPLTELTSRLEAADPVWARAIVGALVARGVRTLGDLRAGTPEQLAELGLTGPQQQLLADTLAELGGPAPAQRRDRGDVVVREVGDGRVDVDKAATIRRGSQLIADGGVITVGAGSVVHAATVVARAGVELGAVVRVEPGVRIVDTPFSPATGVAAPRPVRIGDGAVISANAVIMGGVGVGAGAWIGPGAVVTQDVAAGAVVVPENLVGKIVKARAPPAALRFGTPRTRAEALRQVRTAVATVRYRPMLRRTLRAQVRHPRGLRVAWPVMIDAAVAVEPGPGGRIRLGHQVRVRHRTQLLAEGGEIVIGAFSWMRNTTITGRGGVTVGEYTQFAQGSRIDASRGPVRIGNDVWFGSNVVVQGPATVGDGAIVGAGVVLAGDVPAGSIVVAPGAVAAATGTAAAGTAREEQTTGTDRDARHEPRGEAATDIAPSAWIGPGTVLLPEAGTTAVGEDAELLGVAILAHHDVRIGAGSRVEPGTQIVTFNHNIADTEQPISTQGINGAPIAIGADVWIGPNVVILRGVTIGDGAVIGPGALVLKDVAAGAVVTARGAAGVASTQEDASTLVEQGRAVLAADPHTAHVLLARARTLLDRAGAEPMPAIAAAEGLATAAAAVTAARTTPGGTAIFLDFDGTTAHHVHADDLLGTIAALQAARTMPGVTDLLARLVEAYRTVAFSSGRPADFLDEVVGVPGVDYYGSHGRNRIVGGGTIEVDERVAPYEATLQALIRRYHTAGLKALGVVSQPQAADWALAWDPENLGAIAAVGEIKAAAEAAGLRIGGNPQFPVIDITAPVDTTKGDAVARVAAAEDVRVVVVAGDDKTDLNMFNAVDDALRAGTIDVGVKIAVRDPAKSPQELLDRATVVVEGPEGLREVLAILAGGGPGTGPEQPTQPRPPPDPPSWLQRLPTAPRELLAAELRRYLDDQLRVPTDSIGLSGLVELWEIGLMPDTWQRVGQVAQLNGRHRLGWDERAIATVERSLFHAVYGPAGRAARRAYAVVQAWRRHLAAPPAPQDAELTSAPATADAPELYSLTLIPGTGHDPAALVLQRVLPDLLRGQPWIFAVGGRRDTGSLLAADLGRLFDVPVLRADRLVAADRDLLLKAVAHRSLLSAEGQLLLRAFADGVSLPAGADLASFGRTRWPLGVLPFGVKVLAVQTPLAGGAALISGRTLTELERVAVESLLPADPAAGEAMLAAAELAELAELNRNGRSHDALSALPELTPLLRVALLTREYPPEVYGGAGVHVEFLAAALREQVAVDVHCCGVPRTEPATYAYQLPPPKAAAENAAAQFFRLDVEMAAAIGRTTPPVHVVHSHTWYTNMAGDLAKRNFGVPHVITSHSLEPMRPWKAEQLGAEGYRQSLWMERTAYERADAIIAVSHGMRADVLATYPRLDPARVHVVHNGIDTDFYAPVDADPDVLREHGIDPDRPIVLFIGRISRQKGIDHFVAAARDIRLDAQVVLFSAAPDTLELGEEITGAIGMLAAQRSGVVRVDGMSGPELKRQLLSAATVFVTPSIYEPLGIVNLEAMGTATAVVASDVGGIPEVVADGETGLLVHYDEANPEAFRAGLSQRINELLADPVRAAAMGAAGRARAVREFSWQQAASKTVAIYEQLLGAPAPYPPPPALPARARGVADRAGAPAQPRAPPPSSGAAAIRDAAVRDAERRIGHLLRQRIRSDDVRSTQPADLDHPRKLYGRAWKTLPTWLDIGQELAWGLNGELHDLTKVPVLKTALDAIGALGAGTGRVVVPPLKDRRRVMQKVQAKGAVDQIADVLRLAVVVPWARDLPHGLDVVYGVLERFGWSVDSVHNRLPDGRMSLRYERGFGEVQLTVRDQSGFLAEIRLTTFDLWRVSAAEDEHTLYRRRRRIVEAAHGEQRPLTSSERATVRALDQQAQRIYDAAWHRSLAGPTSGTGEVGAGDGGHTTVGIAVLLGVLALAAGLVALLAPGAAPPVMAGGSALLAALRWFWPRTVDVARGPPRSVTTSVPSSQVAPEEIMIKQRPTAPELRRELQHALQHARITAMRARGTARGAAARARGAVRAVVAYTVTTATALATYLAGIARAVVASRPTVIRRGLIAALLALAVAGLVLLLGGGHGDDPAPPQAAAAARPVPAAPPPPKGTPRALACPEVDRTHRVAAGETLAQIAQRYGTGLERIAADSGVADPNLIKVGQQLPIRGLCTGTTVIAPGATLAGYASQYSTTVTALLALNPQITRSDLIQTGGVLRLASPEPS